MRLALHTLSLLDHAPAPLTDLEVPPEAATAPFVAKADKVATQQSHHPPRITEPLPAPEVTPVAPPEEALKKHSPLSQVASPEAPHGVQVDTAPRAGASLIDIPLPMRLRNHLQHWKFASPMTQKIIRRGLTWKWNPKPPPLQMPPPSTSRGNLYPHISKLLQSGAVISVPLQPCFPSRVFLVPKATGGERLIIDLSHLNTYIFCPTFKMQDVAKIRNSIPKQAWFTSIDLSDAFHHVYIHPRFQKYLAFTLDNQLLFFQAMPFGLNLGPIIFTKVITEALKYLHAQRIPASVYIDDWILWSTTPETLTTNTTFTTTLLQSLGFTINWKKSQLNPSRTLVYLGVLWDGEAHTVAPSLPNINKAITLTSAVLSKGLLTKKRYEKLLGTLNFVAPFVYQGKYHLRQVILKAPKFKKEKSFTLSPTLHQELLWWTNKQNLLASTPISTPPPQLTIWSDASTTGWGGATSQGKTAWGSWPPEEHHLHINALECMAVLRCLQRFNPPLNSSILIRSDNSVVVSLINKQGSNKSNTLNQMLLHILSLCTLKNWSLQARHIPGHLNTWADSLSRSHIIRAEWSLTQHSFNLLTQSMSPEIDLFAHPGNAKLETFGCLFRHPLAAIVDALAANWTQWRTIYLFPPVDLIPLCLKKLSTFQGSGIFIAPHLPSAAWWPAFVTRCAPLDARIEVFQLVQNKQLWARDETSLDFRAYSF